MISYREAAQRIAAGDFSPAYLLCGGESFLIGELSKMLAESFLGEAGDHGREKIEGAALTLQEALQRLEEASLFTPRKLLLVDEPPYLVPKGRESRETQLEESETSKKSSGAAAGQLERFIDRAAAEKIPSRIILFRTAAVDRRRGLFKMLEKKGVVVDCAPLREGELSRWIRDRLARQGKKIESAALQRLLWSEEKDLNFLSSELDKYSAYLAEEEETITAGVVELLFSGDMRGNVFTLTDALSEGNMERALQVLTLLIEKREEPLKIFFMLVRHFRLLLSARSLREEKISPAQHPGALGVQPFAARKLYSQSAAFSCESLEEIIVFLQKQDYKIKTGQVLPRQALEISIAGVHQLRGLNNLTRRGE